MNDDVIQLVEILNTLNTKLAMAVTEEQIVTAFSEQVSSDNADQVILNYYLYEEGEPRLSTSVAVWRSGHLIERDPLMKQKYPLEKMGLSCHLLSLPTKPLFIENLPDFPISVGTEHAAEHQGLCSVLLLPLFAGDQWQGHLTLGWKTQHSFSDQEKALYTALTQTMAIVVSRRRAAHAQEQLRLEAETHSREMEIVARVSTAAAQRLEIDTLLHEIVELTCEEFRLYHVHIYLLDEQEQYLVLAASASQKKQDLPPRTYKMLLKHDNSLAAQSGRNQSGIMINDVTRAENFVPNPLLPDIRAELVVPLLLENKLFGVLNLQANKPNRFNIRILSVMTILAQQLAIAIQNARLYAQQRRVTEELRQLDKLKSQFLANMSHELRTPLNAILNFTHFVATGVFGPVNAEQEDNLRKVIDSASHLLSLINDILDLSKIEAGMMSLFLEDVDFGQLVNKVVASANGLKLSEGVQFMVNVQPDLPMIRADKRRIRQILLNLLSNAAKFTQNGHIMFNVQADQTAVTFSVSDTGAGIAPEHLDLIFEAFKQTDVGVSKGGTGLGLPISRYMAEAHGGQLWVTSELGKGTTFFVRIPAHKEPK